MQKDGGGERLEDQLIKRPSLLDGIVILQSVHDQTPVAACGPDPGASKRDASHLGPLPVQTIPAGGAHQPGRARDPRFSLILGTGIVGIAASRGRPKRPVPPWSRCGGPQQNAMPARQMFKKKSSSCSLSPSPPRLLNAPLCGPAVCGPGRRGAHRRPRAHRALGFPLAF